MLPSIFPALARELRFASRSLSKRPGYFLTATSTLAVGVAGSTLVFSVVDAVALAPLPYSEPGTLVHLYERSLDDADIDRWPVAPANWRDWSGIDGLDRLEAFDYTAPIFSEGPSAHRLRGLAVSGGLFGVLGAEPLQGRVIGPFDLAEDHDVAVVSEGFWRGALGGSPDVVGSDVLLNGDPFEVVGVMPAWFRFPYDRAGDVWVPLRLDQEQITDRAGGSLFTVGRLAPGFTVERLQSSADALARTLVELYPETNGGRGINVIPLRADWLEWRLPALQLFSVAAALALAIAALNLAGLMLSRAVSRTGDLAVRFALGAGPVGLASALFGEAVVIGLLGSIVGALAAGALVPMLGDAAPPNWAGPLLDEASVDGRTLLFTLSVALGSSVVASLLPVVRVAWRGCADALHGAGRSGSGGVVHVSLRRGLVVAQTVVSVALLAQAGMLGRSLHRILDYDLGFDPDGVLTARVPLDDGIADPHTFYRDLRDAVTALAGVEAATVANIAPLSGDGYSVAVTTDGSDPTAGLNTESYNRDVQYRVVDRDFFHTLGIPLLRGRSFDPDEMVGSERVAVVSRAFAEAFLGGREALGATLRTAPIFGSRGGVHGPPLRVVGVVDDVAEWGVWMQPPMIYAPLTPETASNGMTILARTVGPPRSLTSHMEEAVWALGGRWPLERVFSLEEHRDRLYRMNDFLFLVLGIFAGVAGLLSVFGLYGVIALHVGLRAREFSIRRALGSTGGRIRSTVLKEGALLAAAGSLIASVVVVLSAEWIADSWLGNFLFEVGWFDPVSLGAAVLLLGLAALWAAALPARRASSADPAVALKAEG